MHLQKYILKIIFFFLILKVSGQQDPQVSHYQFNPNLVNPGYSLGETGVISTGAFFRTQWTGIEGAPQTASIFAHGALNKSVEIGFTIFNDRIGPEINETNISTDFTYNLRFSRKSSLSLGIKASYNSYNANFQDLDLNSGDNSTDPLFRDNTNMGSLNLGVGAFYHNEQFYFGLAVPAIFRSRENRGNNGLEGALLNEPHLFITAGVLYDINKNLVLKPSLFLKATENAPIAVDLSTNILMNEKLELGLTYRFEDAINFLFSYKISDGMKIGYAYDYTISRLNEFSNGSHEVFLLFTIPTTYRCKCDRFY